MKNSDIEIVVNEMIENMGVFTQEDADDAVCNYEIEGTVRGLDAIMGFVKNHDSVLYEKFTDVVNICDKLLSRLQTMK